MLGDHLGHGVMGFAETQFDHGVETGAFEILARGMGMMAVGLERYETPVFGQSASQPDGRIAAKGPDLQICAAP